ncbi:hypothetical protein [Geotalea uraniireducens]|uniref:Uncharacterized protein n=1 Tax=Geotalea uraniireducens (strain Rf4) TaxID=351605 RepID=A5G6U7_GEOUR|nr:hypothetical protein [Geotalea uraniireducens]ABQ27515.1 hypothetical protein Gura_3358 [Geotalea uraniireducens Rf4]
MVARSHGPHYNFSKFIASCKIVGKVKPNKASREDAKLHYSLMTETELLSFLAHYDFPDLELDNSEQLDKSPNHEPFDAYTFRINDKYVYLAFYQRSNGLWIIKSFHPPKVGDKAPSLSHNPFGVLRGLIS